MKYSIVIREIIVARLSFAEGGGGRKEGDDQDNLERRFIEENDA